MTAKATNGGKTERKQKIEIEPTDLGGPMVNVYEYVIERVNDLTNVLDRSRLGRYAFVRADDDRVADRVRGELPDTDAVPLIYIGDSYGKHFFRSHDIDEVPEDVISALRDRDMVIVDGVDGGWAQWDGRPEWSETYIDYRDAEIVETEE